MTEIRGFCCNITKLREYTRYAVTYVLTHVMVLKLRSKVCCDTSYVATQRMV